MENLKKRVKSAAQGLAGLNLAVLARACHAGVRDAGKRALLAYHAIAPFEPVYRVYDPPDHELYQPLFSPWQAQSFKSEFARIEKWTVVSLERSYVLHQLALQALRLGGDFWECGVYRGGTAMLLAKIVRENGPKLRLFDTFEGMPDTDGGKDFHVKGDFSDTSMEAVRSRIPGDFVRFHKGFMPETFAGLEDSRIAFAHIDVDIYKSIVDCCDFIFPRLLVGGFMIFDDYGFPSCPGARKAVDDFFRDRRAVPLVLDTGQAIVFGNGAKD
jgi:O-methyltransferase